MQALPAKKQEKNCTERYFRGLKNQNEEHLVNLVIKHPRNTSHISIYKLN